MMTQPDLFEPPATFTRRGDSIVPPQREEVAKRKRDDGIRRSSESAGQGWRELAIAMVRLYAQRNAQRASASSRRSTTPRPGRAT